MEMLSRNIEDSEKIKSEELEKLNQILKKKGIHMTQEELLKCGQFLHSIINNLIK